MQENDAQAASDGDWMHGGGAVHETFYLYLVEGLFHGHKSNDKDCSAKKDNSKRPLLHPCCSGLLERPLYSYPLTWPHNALSAMSHRSPADTICLVRGF